ncbi:hypothetical protein ABPG72_018646 [Tetrahymena utriculariae]
MLVSCHLEQNHLGKTKKVISLGSAFSGGLFLSVGLIHILPEAAENFNNYLNSTQHFPFQMLITVISFSFLLLIDRVIGGQFHRANHHNEDEDDTHNEVQQKKHDPEHENQHKNNCNDHSAISHAQHHNYNNFQNIVKYSQKQHINNGNNNLQSQNEIQNGQYQNILSFN